MGDWQMASRYHPSAGFGRCARTLLASFAGVTAMALAAAPSQAQEFVMKFSTLTLNDVQHEFIKMYKAELEKITNNRIRVDIYPAGQLGNAQRQSEGIRLGTIEAATGPGELFVGADPRFQVLAMAGLFKDKDHVRRAIVVPQVRQAIEEIATSRGLVMNGIYLYDTQSFLTKAPMTKLADFAGKRIRVLASEGERAQVDALGASSVPMTLGEVLPALQQGTIDGVNSGMPVFVSLKYYDAATNVLDTHLWSIITISLVSKVFHDKLPPDLKKAVVDAGNTVQPLINTWQIERLKQDYAAWASRGGKLVTLSPAEQAEAEKRSSAAIQPVLDKSAPLKESYGKIKAGAATVQ
jgi:TRAP-type C4-dicarboxylate transport system substrate-binding protein